MRAVHEIVRRPAGPQPWLKRTVAQNGNKISRTETYARRRGAEAALLAEARAFGYDNPSLTWNVGSVQALLWSGLTISGRPVLTQQTVIAVVRYLDER